MAECIALSEGLQFAKEMGFTELEVESDASNVVAAVKAAPDLSVGSLLKTSPTIYMKCFF